MCGQLLMLRLVARGLARGSGGHIAALNPRATLEGQGLHTGFVAVSGYGGGSILPSRRTSLHWCLASIDELEKRTLDVKDGKRWGIGRT